MVAGHSGGRGHGRPAGHQRRDRGAAGGGQRRHAGGRRARGAGAGTPTTDPRFGTCKEANTAGYGPYYRGLDPEYAWYIDRNKDGVVCD
ncbi:excalibur calcium-binding domain-containing protein [Micromonospora sp. NPDC005087]|uniref:excalibur calcium-binding domain-containing protein n=1 Tax=Micromonospora sp. NPDC005087 TaxID=3364225 RepID=UPI00368EB4E3